MIEPQQWLIGEPEYLHPQHARFRFRGRFQQRDVIWHCNLYTLQHFADTFHAGEQEVALQQRLVIDSRDGEQRITVALALPVIDRGAIHKTMIMVRNYKRLHEGEHCYGETYRFRPTGKRVG